MSFKMAIISILLIIVLAINGVSCINANSTQVSGQMRMIQPNITFNKRWCESVKTQCYIDRKSRAFCHTENSSQCGPCGFPAGKRVTFSSLESDLTCHNPITPLVYHNQPGGIILFSFLGNINPVEPRWTFCMPRPSHNKPSLPDLLQSSCVGSDCRKQSVSFRVCVLDSPSREITPDCFNKHTLLAFPGNKGVVHLYIQGTLSCEHCIVEASIKEVAIGCFPVVIKPSSSQPMRIQRRSIHSANETAPEGDKTNTTDELSAAPTVSLTDSKVLKTDKGNSVTDSKVLKTDEGISVTDLKVPKTDEGISVTDSKVLKTDGGVSVTDSKVLKTDEEISVTDSKVLKTDEGISVTDSKVLKTDEGISVTDSKVLKTDEGISVTDSKVLKTDEGISVTDSKVLKTDEEISVTDSKVLKTDEAISVTDSKVLKTDEAISVTESKALKTDEAISVTESKALKTDEGISVTESKVLKTDEAISVTESKALKTDEAISVTESKALKTDEGISVTESKALKTDEAISVTESKALKTDEGISIAHSKVLKTDEVVSITDSKRSKTNGVNQSQGLSSPDLLPQDAPKQPNTSSNSHQSSDNPRDPPLNLITTAEVLELNASEIQGETSISLNSSVLFNESISTNGSAVTEDVGDGRAVLNIDKVIDRNDTDQKEASNNDESEPVVRTSFAKVEDNISKAAKVDDNISKALPGYEKSTSDLALQAAGITTESYGSSVHTMSFEEEWNMHEKEAEKHEMDVQANLGNSSYGSTEPDPAPEPDPFLALNDMTESPVKNLAQTPDVIMMWSYSVLGVLVAFSAK